MGNHCADFESISCKNMEIFASILTRNGFILETGAYFPMQEIPPRHSGQCDS